MSSVKRPGRRPGPEPARTRAAAGGSDAPVSIADLRLGPGVTATRWIEAGQRLVGNQAVASVLGRSSPVQREAPVPGSPGETAPAGGGAGPEPTAEGSREPTEAERAQWGKFFNGADFRIVRSPEVGYNCYSWALGITDRIITTDTLMGLNYQPNVEGWTKYLADRHRLTPTRDGLDPTADLILYGQSPTAIWHAARKADAPFEKLTFSSKLGDDRTPVILHAPADIQGHDYGSAQRSFRRA